MSDWCKNFSQLSTLQVEIENEVGGESTESSISFHFLKFFFYNILVVGVWGSKSQCQLLHQSGRIDEKQIASTADCKNPESCSIWMQGELSAHESQWIKNKNEVKKQTELILFEFK